jgi:hypothetical protein
VNDSDNRNHQVIEHTEEERLTTADLADAGRGGPCSTQAEDTRSEEVPVEIIDPPDARRREANWQGLEARKTNLREGAHDALQSDRDPDRAATAAPIPVPASGQTISSSSASAAAAAPARERHIEEAASGPLFASDESASLRQRWDAIQVGFVDEPRRSVEEADNLVAVAIKRLAEQFATERSKLEGQWTQGTDVSTEDLRQALRRYRSFFSRILNV